MRARARAVVDSRRFQNFITGVIVFNAITLGLETSATVTRHYGDLLHVLDRVALAIFVAELLTRGYAYRLSFFRDPWNWFDTVVVGIALVPTTGGLSVLRSLRILRALRLLSLVPSMRRVVSSLLAAMPGIGSIAALLALVLYISGVMATKLFGETSPKYFGDLGTSLFTLFQAMTGEGWPEIAREVMDTHPWAWIFFVIYILVTTFVMVNLFLAVVVSAMESTSEELQSDIEELEEREERTDALVLAELRALREDLAALREQTGSTRATDQQGEEVRQLRETAER